MPVLEQQSSVLGWRTGRWSLFAHCSEFPALSLSRLCIGSACSVHGSSELNRQGVLTDPGVNCIFCLGCLGKEHQEGRTAPVPWASSAASLSPEMRKKSVSVVCTVQNPKCLTVLSGCLLGVVFFSSSYGKEQNN